MQKTEISPVFSVSAVHSLRHAGSPRRAKLRHALGNTDHRSGADIGSAGAAFLLSSSFVIFDEAKIAFRSLICKKIGEPLCGSPTYVELWSLDYSRRLGISNVRPSVAKSVASNRVRASFSSTRSSLYRAEKWPISNRPTSAIDATFAACNAVA